MTARSRKVLCTAIAACLAIACPKPLLGQAADEEGPIIIGQRRQYDRLHFDRPEYGLELRGIYQRDQTSSATSDSTTNQYILEQTLDLRTHGYVLSPNFFEMSLYAAGGLSETWVDADTDGTKLSDSSTGSIYEWDVSGTFQPNGETPLTLTSRREQSWVFRQFGPALETISTDTGAALDIRSRTLPTRFAVSHLESEQNGLQDIDNYSYTRDGFDWHTTWLPTANQTWNWDYNFARVDQSGVTQQSYDTHEARLSHDVTFGQRQQHVLTSTLDYYRQTGDVDLQRFRWDERLRMRPTDDLRTRLDYTYDRSDNGGVELQRHRATAGFTHDLFDSLTTNGNVGVEFSDAEGAQSRELFADIDWRYRKHVPLGTFSANLGLAWSKQDSDAGNAVTQVIDQPATFGDSQPIVIVGTNVNPNTIVITDPSGLLLYQPGVDYTVTQFPDRVEIDRVIGGAIPSGQSVLLDYHLNPLPAANTTSRSFSTGARYDFEEGLFKGVTVFTQYSQAKQDIESDQPGAFVPNEFTDITYGAQYQVQNLIVGAEHQHHDSTINPFDADRFFARYTQQMRADLLLGFNLSYTSIDYFEPSNHVDLMTASAQLVYNFTRRLTGNLTLLYRNEDDDLHGVTKGFEEQFELRWRHRQTQVYAVLRNAQLENPSEDQSFQFFQIGLRREF